MKIGLHDAEQEYMKHKTFPNYALMKISAYYKTRGNTIEWWNPLLNNKYDIVYSSKVFDFTPENPYRTYHPQQSEAELGMQIFQ